MHPFVHYIHIITNGKELEYVSDNARSPPNALLESSNTTIPNLYRWDMRGSCIKKQDKTLDRTPPDRWSSDSKILLSTLMPSETETIDRDRIDLTSTNNDPPQLLRKESCDRIRLPVRKPSFEPEPQVTSTREKFARRTRALRKYKRKAISGSDYPSSPSLDGGSEHDRQEAPALGDVGHATPPKKPVRRVSWDSAEEALKRLLILEQPSLPVFVIGIADTPSKR